VVVRYNAVWWSFCELWYSFKWREQVDGRGNGVRKVFLEVEWLKTLVATHV